MRTPCKKLRLTQPDKIVASIIKGLKTVANTPFDSEADFLKISSAAEDTFFALYKAGVSNTDYTPEVKQTLGPLVPPALQGLGHQVALLQIHFSSYSTDTVRIQRSGLQFFIDVFKDFPATTTGDRPETLEETIKEFVEREDVEGLDERLRAAEFDFYTDDGDRSVSFQAEIDKLPSTHWWFFD